jgi:hypothetical protein
MTDLNSVGGVVDEGKDKPAINQLEAYINKVKTEITKGDLPETTGQHLIQEATNLINMIRYEKTLS